MIRALAIVMLVLTLTVSPLAFARDDGGFGSARFTSNAPAALGGETIMSSKEMVASPSDVEPAAGDEEDVTAPEEDIDSQKELQNSNHVAEPIIIQKDISVR